MEKRSILKYILIVLMVFFSLQLLSHLFWKVAQHKEAGEKNRWLRWSAHLMPPDSDPQLEYGAVLLIGSMELLDQRKIERSVAYLQRAINRNMLQYLAHQYLGQALFYVDYPQSPHFEQALIAFKRAVWLRGQNPAVSFDTLRLLLSLWPLLGEVDRLFTRALFKKTTAVIKPPDVKSLLEVWSLYVRDIELLEFSLKDVPQYFKEAAEELAKIEMFPDYRQIFLARFEVYWLGYALERYRNIHDLRVDVEKNVKSLLRRLDRGIKGYYKNVGNGAFDEAAYLTLKRRLYVEVLEFLLSREVWQTGSQARDELKHLILNYIRDLPYKDDLEILHQILESGKIFGARELWARELRLLLYFQMENYNQVIEEAEDLRHSFSFIRKDQMEDYVDILLLLVDAYMEADRYEGALKVLEEAEKLAAQPVDVYWRIMKAETAIGRKRVQKGDMYERIRDSHWIDLLSTRLSTTVYLIDSHVFQIRLSEQLMDKLRDKHLLQVFIDNRIVGEYYLSRIEGYKINVEVKGKKAFHKVLVEIKII